jgi:hypothetical protein
MKLIYIVFTITLINGCHEDPTNIDDLINLDARVRKHTSIIQLREELSCLMINEEEVCCSSQFDGKSREECYQKILTPLGISKKEHSFIVNRMDRIGYIEYIRQDDYSIWVKGGAFGDIYGIIINHSNDPITRSLTIKERYHISVYEQLDSNAYYFSN